MKLFLETFNEELENQKGVVNKNDLRFLKRFDLSKTPEESKTMYKFIKYRGEKLLTDNEAIAFIKTFDKIERGDKQ